MNGVFNPLPPEAYGDPAKDSAEGFESAPQLMRRALRTRPAQSPLHRLLAGSADLFRGDDYPQRLAEQAAGTQLPVTTGRRIALVGTRGGAGKTTVAALLARIYAAMRADTVAAVDLAPGTGTLGLRLGVPHAPPLESAAARLQAGTPDSLRGLTALLAVAEPGNLLVAGRRRVTDISGAGGTEASAAHVWTPAGPHSPDWTPGGGAGSLSLRPGEGHTGQDHTGQDHPGQNIPLEVPDGVSRMARNISRYCPITIFDCSTGLTDPATRWAASHSHVAVFVTPASVAGLEDALEYAAAWRGNPLFAGTPLLVLVVQPPSDRTFSASREAGRLSRAGAPAIALGHDRHLAAGVEVSPSLLSRRSRLEAVTVASRVLSAAIPSPMPQPAAHQPTRRNAHA